ncbi:MAG: UbiA prenyltransferase family protein [Planctomycetota bacterium]
MSVRLPAFVDPLRPALESLRPLHWSKNLVVLAPLVFAGRLVDPPSLRLSGLMVAAFCLLASAGYLLNDLHDLRVDRLHSAHRLRPLARGALSPRAAALLAVVLLGAALLLAGFVQRRAEPLVSTGLASLGPLDWCLAYVALGAAYTLLLKRLAGIDLVALAAFFTLRACAGAAALQLAPSPWLLACASLLALFLGAGKRRLELLRLGPEAAAARPMLYPWSLPLLDRLILVLAIATVAVFAVYALADDTAAHIGSRNLVFTVPLVGWLVWRHRSRVAAATTRTARRKPGQAPPPRSDDPVEILLSDRPSVAAFLIWCAAVLYVVYRPW